MTGLILLKTVARELPMPPWAFGLTAFIVLGITMLITLAVGKGRPHS